MSIKIYCDCGDELDIETHDISIDKEEVVVEVTVAPCAKCMSGQYDLGETTGNILGREEAMEEALSTVNELVEKALNEQS